MLHNDEIKFTRDKNGDPLTPRGENGKPKLNEELQTRQWSDRTIRCVDIFFIGAFIGHNVSLKNVDKSDILCNPGILAGRRSDTGQ